jgi:hypothetical protein
VALAKDEQKTENIEALKKAGAVAPPAVEAATLQSYAGKYKSEGPLELNVSVRNGKLFTTAGGPQSFQMLAIEKTTFVPIDFDGITLTFKVEQEKTTGAALKQGQNVTQLKRVEEVKEQPKP